MSDEAPSLRKAILASAKKHYVLTSILAIVALLATSIVWNAYAPKVLQYGDQQQAASEIRDQVTDAEYAMKQYKWFEEQEQKIIAMEGKIQNVRDSMKRIKQTYGNDTSEWSRTTRTTYNRELQELQGYQDQHENLVADYNYKMNSSLHKHYNDSLPLEMEKKFWTGDLVP